MPAAASSVVCWNPAVAAPTGAVTTRLAPPDGAGPPLVDGAGEEAAEGAADGAADAAPEAAGDPDGAPDPAGEAEGAGA